MKRKNDIELSKVLRIKTLRLILEGKSVEEMADELMIKPKTVKHRLTLLFKFYGVKNRYQLMALYIKIPPQWFLHIKTHKERRFERPNGRKEQLKNNWKHTTGGTLEEPELIRGYE